MAYTLKQSNKGFTSGVNILASEIVQYVHAGATLDGSTFDEGMIEVGTLIARNTDTGKYEPYPGLGEGEEGTPSGYDNFFIMNEDHDHDGETDAVTGAVIIAGSVYEDKLPKDVPSEFKKANQNIFYVSNKGADTP